MTRTDVLALSRSQTAGAAPMRRGSPRPLRRLLVLPVTLLLALALAVPMTAGAATTGKEGLSGYKQTPKPSTGTSPAKEKASATKPAKETAPAKTTSAPTKESAKSSTLPFTGLDLRWTIGAGLLLMAAGLSIVTVQRRQRRHTRR